MAELPFVDTHVHFWDLDHPKLHYSWLQPGWIHPVLGDIDLLKVRHWEAEHLKLEVLHANVTKVVHVQAALGISDPVEETIWLEEAAEQTGFPNAIVAYADLTSPSLEAELNRNAQASPRLRGIRDFGQGDYLVDPEFQRGYALLEKFNLVCDLDCTWEDMGKARDLARTAPGVTMVLDHAGFPRERTTEYLESWKRGMNTLAEAESVYCKISGLGMCDPEWTVDSIRPWVLHCIEAFGIERCVMGTNWPVDKLYSNYDKVVDAYFELIQEFSLDEQASLFSANAERIFRI